MRDTIREHGGAIASYKGGVQDFRVGDGRVEPITGKGAAEDRSVGTKKGLGGYAGCDDMKDAILVHLN